MKRILILMCLLIAVFAGVAGVAGCATMRHDAQPPTIERALDRAEFALSAAELALAMWDAQAVEHPEIDRWPEERVKLAEAVKEARAVVDMLQVLMKKETK